MLEIWSQTVR